MDLLLILLVILLIFGAAGSLAWSPLLLILVAVCLIALLFGRARW